MLAILFDISRRREGEVDHRRRQHNDMASSDANVTGGKGKNKTPHFWSDRETIFMLDQMREMNILRYLDGRKNRNGDIFQKVSTKMREAGFVRTVEQIRCRWKSLKQPYFKAKKQNNTSGSDPATCPYFEILDEMLGHRPMATSDANGVDVGFNEAGSSTSEEQQGKLTLTVNLW